MKFTVAQKIRLAQLIRKRKDRIQGSGSSTSAKRRAWEEVFKHLVAQGVPITTVHHLKMVIVADKIHRGRANSILMRKLGTLYFTLSIVFQVLNYYLRPEQLYLCSPTNSGIFTGSCRRSSGVQFLIANK